MEFSMKGYPPAPIPWKIIHICTTIFQIFVLCSNHPKTHFVWYHKFLDHILAELEKPQNHSDSGASVQKFTNTGMCVNIKKPQNHSRFGAKVLKCDTCMHVNIEKPQNHS